MPKCHNCDRKTGNGDFCQWCHYPLNRRTFFPFQVRREPHLNKLARQTEMRAEQTKKLARQAQVKDEQIIKVRKEPGAAWAIAPFRLSRENNSETKTKEKNSPKSDSVIQRQAKELLGREFRTVNNGLDPEEVMTFLETAVGSSEATVKRLEHMVSLHRLSQTMERMVEETRQFSDDIKEIAKQEAEAEKAEILEEAQRRAEEMVAQVKKNWSASIQSANSILLEAQRKAEEMVDQTKTNCSALIENANSALLEAAAKAREVEMAFQNVKEMMDMGTESVRQSIPDLVNSTRRDLSLLYEQYTKELSILGSESGETSSYARDQATIQAEGVPESAKVDKSEKTPDIAPEPHLTSVETEEGEPLLTVEAHAAPKKGAPLLFSGKVILAIPQEAGPSWMEQLRQRLRNIRGVSILLDVRTNAGVSIMHLSLDEPVPLASILLEMPNLESVVEDYQKVEEYSGGLAKILSQHVLNGQHPTMLAVVLSGGTTE